MAAKKRNGQAATDDEHNPRPEVEVEIGGRKWDALIDYRAIGQIEAKVGPLWRLMKQTLELEFGVTDTAVILAEAIKSANPNRLTPPPDELGPQILEAGLVTFGEARTKLLQHAFAGPKTRTGEAGGEA